MKRWWMWAGVLGCAVGVCAQPPKVAVSDFEVVSAMAADEQLAGRITKPILSNVAPLVLMENLVQDGRLKVIDRRDLLGQMAKQDELASRVEQLGGKPSAKSDLLRAAQALGADYVIRGSVTSFSTSRRAVDLKGYQTDFLRLDLGLAIEALDVRDGTVLKLIPGKASREYRQTKELNEQIGEGDVAEMIRAAVADAGSRLASAVTEMAEAGQKQPRVRIAVTTTADPALVELDGMLIGTTPLDGVEVYSGDHVLTVGKAGYHDVVSRVQMDRDLRIQVPLLKTELSADEAAEVIKSLRFAVVVTNAAWVISDWNAPLVPLVNP